MNTLQIDKEKYINKIIFGDAIKEMENIHRDGIVVDAIITDPPYNISKKNGFSTLKKPRKGIDFGEWDKGFNQTSWIKPAIELLKNGGNIIIFNTWRNISYIANELEKNGCAVKDLIRWIKTNPMPRNMNRRYISDYEFAIWAVKGNGKWTSNKDKKGYLIPEIKTGTVSGREKTKHPTQKSIILMKKLIEIHTNEKDLVLDPFTGSGTTIDACTQLKRNFIGVEISEEYHNIAENRLKKSEILL